MPPDIEPGDHWYGAEVLTVNRVLRYITAYSSDPAFSQFASQDPEVLYVEADRFVAWITYTPNDPSWSNQYGPEAMNTDLAWDTTLGTTVKNVCIVDSGVRSTHEDLTGARWLGGYDFVNDDTNPSDDNGHGTHVAGIAAATTNNAKGIAGVAQVGIKAAKVLNSNGQGFTSWIVAGIQWCADNEGHVINLSLGSSADSSTLRNAVEYAWDEGSVVVAAAGNDGPCSNCVLYPAAYPDAIAVSCTTASNAQCSFTSDGPEIDLAAPGYDIYSTCYASNTNYCYKSGTSMSSPHAAGTAALIWSYSQYATNADIRSALEENAIDLGAAGWDQLYGWGLVDAKAALDSLEVIFPQDPILTENLDDGSADGWTLSGLWHVSNLCGAAASSPYYLGFHATGSCSYANAVLRSSGEARFAIDLTGQLQATLTFKHRWETETGSGAVDVRSVEISANGGSSWTTLASWDSDDANQANWRDGAILLNDHVGGLRDVRFLFDSVDGLDNAYDGWHIDDVIVTATDNFPPVALAGPDRTVSDNDGSGDAPVSMDGSASFDQNVGGTIVSYEWFAGTTLLGTGPAPTLLFPVGTTITRLVVTDNDGDSDDDTLLVNVLANVPPVARAGSDQALGDPDGTGDASVLLSGATSTDSDGTIVAYEWRKGATVYATTVSPTVNLPVGIHDITLTVTDNGGATHADVVRITVNANVPPVANAGPDKTASDGDGDGSASIAVSGTGSSDADGTLAGHEWKEGATVLSTAAAPTLTLPVGAHTVTLTVTDNGGATATDTTILTINPNQAPTAAAGSDRTISDPDNDGFGTVALDGSGSTDADGSILSYLWTEGATTLGTTALLSTDLPLGVHTLTLTVTDNGGAAGTDDVVITIVDNLPPVALFADDCIATNCDFDGTLSTDDGTIVSWDWTFGDSTSGSGATLSHSYAVEDVYVVCLTVTDNDGATDTLCQDVTAIGLLFLAEFDEGTAPDFTLTGIWHVSSNCATPPTEPKYLGYHRTTACNINTGTSNSGDAQFTVDLSEVSEPTLRFHHRWDTASSAFPIHRQLVQVKPTSSSTWTTLEQWDAREADQFSWLPYDADLSAWSGQTVNLRFRFEAGTSSSTTNNVPGWFIDVVQVGTPVSLITPNNRPNAVAGADIVAADPDGSGDQVVTVDGSASSDDDGTIVAYEWTEGATVLGTTASLTRAYTVGTHTLTLTVNDDGGKTGTDTVLVTVNANVAPIARAGADRTLSDANGDGSESVTLDGTTSSDADGAIVSYLWKEGATTLSSDGAPTLGFTVGTHIVTLTVTDDGGKTASDTVVVTVNANTAPNAAAGADATLRDLDGTGFEPATLSGAASTDAEAAIVAYEWREGAALLGTGSGLTVSLAVGVHTVTLTVTDLGGLTDTDDVVITVFANLPPTADAGPDVLRNDDDRTGAEPIALNGLGSNDPDGGITSWIWSEDGTVLSTAPSTIVSFAVGVHLVTLTVADASGTTASDSLIVTITNNRPPVADLAFTCETESVQCHFDGTASSDPDGDAISYAWAFGDGASATFALGPHAYPSAGKRTACLTVSDGNLVDVDCAIVHLITTTFLDTFDDGNANGWTRSGLWRVDDACSDAPSGEFYLGYHLSLICMYQEVERTMGAASFPLDLTTATTATMRFSHRWVTETTSGTTARDEMKIQVSQNGGTSWATLKVWDSRDPNQPQYETYVQNLNTYAGKNIQIRFWFDSFNQLFNHYSGWHIDNVRVLSDAPAPQVTPTAAFTSSCTELLCSFDGSTSSDAPYGVIAGWHWNFGDGSTATGEDVTHQYMAAGTYSVVLTVTDNGGAVDTETKSVTITGVPPGNDPPTAGFAADIDGLSVHVDASTSTDPEGDPLTFAWDFGDGATATGLEADHTYAADGTYTVTLTVSDGELSDDATLAVTVSSSGPVNNPPYAAFSATIADLAVNVDASLSFDPDDDPLTFAWDFGDGATATGETASHTYATAGTYTITLTVTDDEGLFDTETDDVTVQAMPPITGPPSAPPANPHVPDTQASIMGDIIPVPWMDIESAWFAADGDQFFAGLKVADIPSTDRVMSYVAYRITFTPEWTIADPTYGGAIPAGETTERFELRALLTPAGAGSSPNIRYTVWVQTEDLGHVTHWRQLAEVAGTTSVSTDILWWPVARTLIQAPVGLSTLTDPSAIVHLMTPQLSPQGPTADSTGTGQDFSF